MQNIDEAPLTLRIRRERTTYFISSSPFESIDTLKRKILIFHKGLEVGDLRLYYANKVQMIEDLGLSFLYSSCSMTSPICTIKGSSITPWSTSNSKKVTVKAIDRYRRVGRNTLTCLMSGAWFKDICLWHYGSERRDVGIICMNKSFLNIRRKLKVLIKLIVD